MPDGEAILNRITRTAADLLQQQITAAGGREVFFAGILDPQGMVDEVRVLARGHAEAVPALFTQLNPREVVIHNHPSGNLAPSNADLELAAIYSAHGHGVFIIDNPATRVYVVVEPSTPRKKTLLNARELVREFSNGSTLAKSIGDFELRPQQVKMAEAIIDAFNNDGMVVVEAPTGVGKTMAYLLPALQWAKHNKERIVVSTRTINLQEQIIHHDLPLLQQGMEEPLHACLVKGRSNYLCRRKLEHAFAEISLFDDETGAGQLRLLNSWADDARGGSLAELHFVPDRAVWEKVSCEADMCAGGSCRHFQSCFFMAARKEMARADLLVVNHHMLFADVAVKKELGDFTGAAVLPKYSRVIFDEAHSIEDAATEYFGVNATRAATQKTLGRLLRIEMQSERGLIPFLKLKLMRNCPQVTTEEYETFVALIDNQIHPALLLALDALDEAFTGLREYTAEAAGQMGREIKWRLTPDILAQPELRRLHDETIMPAVNNLRALVRFCEGLLEKLTTIKPYEPEDESPVLMEVLELTALIRKMQNIADALGECTRDTLEDNTVRWIEIDSKYETHVRVARCPLAVGKPLAEWVYNNLDTVVMTSATLAVRKQFTYFKNRVGLDLLDDDKVQVLLLDSPFDYAKQAMLCIPTDTPPPSAPEFLESCEESIRRILEITGGHAFILFTSFYALDHAYRKLEEELQAQGITPLCQGKATRSQLLDAFRKDPKSVLFATDSFWEGVDVAGDALQCVIVTRLPFRVPSEPVLEARAQAIEQAGGNAFMQYSVPQAVIKLRQGFGRLIRRRTDWGAVIILDNRIISKYYGRTFITSLPALPVAKGTSDETWDALQAFYEAKRADMNP
jgi:ATP-dependent DNA helicase DinG